MVLALMVGGHGVVVVADDGVVWSPVVSRADIGLLVLMTTFST